MWLIILWGLGTLRKSWAAYYLGQCGSRNCAVDTCHPSDVPEHVINLSDNINNNNNDKEQQEEAKPEEKPSSAYTLYGYFMEKVGYWTMHYNFDLYSM